MKNIFFLITFLLSLLALAAQDSIRQFPSHNISFRHFGRRDTLHYDTCLAKFDYYPAASPFHWNASTGKFASASTSLTQRKGESMDFLRYHNYQNLLTPDDFRSYTGDSVFANIFYSAGINKNLRFNVDFAQRITRHLSYNLKTRYSYSPEYYQNDEKKLKSFNFNFSYQLPSRIYSLDFGYIHNKINNRLNGGLKSIEYFQNNDLDPEDYPVNLSNASYFYKNNFYLFNHTIQLTPLFSKIVKDSLCDLGSITVENFFRQARRVYQDQNINYYPATLDSLKTFDSIALLEVHNTILWNKNNLLFPRLSSKFGIDLFKLSASDSIENFSVSGYAFIGVLDYRYRNFLLHYASTDIFALGDFEHIQDFSIDYHRPDRYVRYSLEINRLAPPYRYWREYGNHYQWENDLVFSGELNNALIASYKSLALQLDYNTFSHYVYLSAYDEALDDLPRIRVQQADEPVSLMRLSMRDDLHLWHFNLKSRLAYQLVSHPEIMPLPKWLAGVRLSFSHRLFGVSTFAIGADAMMHAKYYARAFSPALQEFYVQHRQELGEYLYLNAFLRFKLKRVRFYIQYSNIGYYFQQKGYFEVPAYPSFNPGLSYGLSWIFYN